MSETTVSTGLEPLAPGQLSLVSGTFKIQDVADKLTEPVPPAEAGEDRPIPFPDLPKHVELTANVRSALNKLPKIFGRVELDKRRALSPVELEQLADEDIVVSLLLKTMKDRQDTIRESIRVHNDVTAEDGGDAFDRPHGPRRSIPATPRAHDGHYLLATPGNPHVTGAPGVAKGWQQKFVSGSTSQSLAQLELLLASGQIDRKEYLACTREVRVLDESRMEDFIRKNADRGLRILKAITVRKPPNSQLTGPSRD